MRGHQEEELLPGRVRYQLLRLGRYGGELPKNEQSTQDFDIGVRDAMQRTNRIELDDKGGLEV